MTSLRRLMFAKAASGGSGGGWRTATGAVASFIATRSTALPMQFDLLPIQTGEGDPSPENVRPITGHDGFTRTGTGKNLLDIDALISAPSGKIATYDFKHVYVIQLEPNTNYTLSTSYSGTRNVLYFNSANAVDVVRSGSPVTKVSSATGELIIGLFDRTGIGQFEDKTVTVQLEKGDSATAYQPFGHSYQTTFPTPPGTVYGCHVRDNGDGTVKLTVDKIGVDMSMLTWSGRKTGDINKLWSATLPEYYDPDYSHKLGWMCDKFTEGNPSSAALITPDTANVGIYSLRSTAEQSNTIYMVIPKEDTPDGFLVYEIIEPQTYTLSMDAIQSLIGQNNIWVDNADSVTVEYWGH